MKTTTHQSSHKDRRDDGQQTKQTKHIHNTVRQPATKRKTNERKRPDNPVPVVCWVIVVVFAVGRFFFFVFLFLSSSFSFSFFSGAAAVRNFVMVVWIGTEGTEGTAYRPISLLN